MTTDTRRAFAVYLSLAAFLLAIWVIKTTEAIILIGECGVGPAAPTDCTWDQRK
jgi:hypothetical protein